MSQLCWVNKPIRFIRLEDGLIMTEVEARLCGGICGSYFGHLGLGSYDKGTSILYSNGLTLSQPVIFPTNNKGIYDV